MVRIGGVVEDTTFEAKAKDSKKSEVKAKDRLFENRPSKVQKKEGSMPRPRTEDTIISNYGRSQKKKSSFKKPQISR